MPGSNKKKLRRRKTNWYLRMFSLDYRKEILLQKITILFPFFWSMDILILCILKNSRHEAN